MSPLLPLFRLGIVLFLSLLCAQTQQTPEFRILIARILPGRHSLPQGSGKFPFYFNVPCNPGNLEVWNKYGTHVLFLSTLEPDGLKSIPDGTYSAHLVYHHLDQWRIQLDNVPGRSAIQIHVGNYPSQTEGCILVGKGHPGFDFGAAAHWCALRDSKTAYNELKKAFYGTDNPVATPDVRITVKVTSEQPE